MVEGRRVAITGLGIVTAIGHDVETYSKSLFDGRSGVSRLTGFDTTDFDSKIAGQIPDFDPLNWLEKRTAARMDRFTQMGMAAVIQAVEDSGIDFDKEDRFRCGALIGTGIGGIAEIEAQHKRLLEKGPKRVSPFLVPKLMANACAGQVSIRYGIMGPNVCCVSACASSSHSIGQAFRAISWGDAEVMITGGAEAALTPLGVAGFCAARALSTRNDEPERASRPFDRERDGFIMGEGAGAIVLEELDHARKRGADIYAEFLGFGQTGDATHIVQPDPDGRGAASAMAHALLNGRTNPEEVTYINAHGTSTPLGDKAETAAIKRAFGEHARSLAVSSTKSMLGHLLGASGATEIVATCLCVGRDMIHATINYENPDFLHYSSITT